MSDRKWQRSSLRHLSTQLGERISHTTVGRLLHEMKYALRVNVKCLTGEPHPDREPQFGYIEQQKRTFLQAGLPVISVDAKKKELIGQFRNAGRTLRREPLEVLATDFLHDALGKAIPYGIYDIQRNEGWMAVGVSHETAALAVATIRRWLLEVGRVYYPDCYQLLIQADSGGANACDSWLWKVELQKLANEFQLAITVTHYPTGASKWNPIEHRMFSVVSQNWAGQPLISYETVLKFIRTSKTDTGFRCRAYLDRRKYKTQCKVTPEQKARLNLHPHRLFPQWNYTIRPNNN